MPTRKVLILELRRIALPLEELRKPISREVFSLNLLNAKTKDMKYGSLLLEKKEYVYLKRILNISGYAEDFETQKSLQRFSDELKMAQILNEEDMPKDIIRFNSKIMLHSESGWEKVIQLVAPADKDSKQDKISILTPMGTSLLGYSEGDMFEWDFPFGKQKIKIGTVTQDTSQKKIEVPI